MRPQRRETAHRPGTGTLPPMERQPRRPPHLGTAPAHRINPAQITPAPAWPPRTATSALGMPSHRTSEYLHQAFGIGYKTVAGTDRDCLHAIDLFFNTGA